MWHRNQEGVAVAMAERSAAAERAKAEVQRLVSAAVRAQVARDAARSEAERLRKVVAPLVNMQIKQAVKLVELGETEVLILQDALESWLETQLSIIQADLDEAQAANILYTMLHPQWIAVPACEGNCIRQKR